MNRQWGQPAHPSSGEPVAISWVRPKGIAWLSVINLLLMVVTLGAYQFWGKTEVRKRIWSAIRIQGEPLAYTGTGRELFGGFIIVFFAVLVPLYIAYNAAILLLGPQSPWLLVILFVLYRISFFLFDVGTYRAMRYRLSRTRWRGIRAGLAGSPMRYAWASLGATLLSTLTLGWSEPWRYTILQRRVVNDMWFGDRPFSFNAQPGPLYGPFAVMWIAGVVLFFGAVAGIAVVLVPSIQDAERAGGYEHLSLSAAQWAKIAAIVLAALLLYSLSGAWFSARKMNHFAAHTYFEGGAFRANATAGSLLLLEFTNLLLVLLSLRLLSPLVQARSAAYFIRRLAFDGQVPLDAIGQGAMTGGRYGEGIAQIFSIDAF